MSVIDQNKELTPLHDSDQMADQLHFTVTKSVASQVHWMVIKLPRIGVAELGAKYEVSLSSRANAK